MGRYDDITEDRLCADLVRFAELILRLDEEDGLLVSPADLQTLLGELRRKLFAWEIRCSQSLEVDSGDLAEEAGGGSNRSGEGTSDDVSAESLRIVRDALRRQNELRKEWDSDSDSSGENSP